MQKPFLVPRQNLQFLFRVASLFVVLCMYLSSYVVCADLVCILWVSTIHMCPWGIIFSIYHNSARLCCLTQRASDLVEWGPMLQCAREGWHTLCSSDNFAPLEQLSCIQTHFASQHTLLPNTNTLIHSTLCSPKQFTPWNTLLPGTLCFKHSREKSMLRRKIFQEAKCTKK